MGKISGCQQFLILLYKGMLLRKRHYICTVFEIVIPVLIACVLPIMQSEMSNPKPKFEEEEHTYKQTWINASFYPPVSPYYTIAVKSSNLTLVYFPSNNMTDKLMDDAIENFKTHVKYTGQISKHTASSEKDLEDFYLYSKNDYPDLLIIGTVFNNFQSAVSSLPDSMDYKIRYGSLPFRYPLVTDQKYQFNGPQTDDQYSDTFFLSWQHAIEETFIQSKNGDSENKIDYQIMLQRFPYPEHKNPADAITIITVVPWLIAYGYLVFIINIVRRVIEEKSNGSKELMKMMGMTDFVYWGSTFFNYFIIALFTSLVIAIVYKVPLKNSYIFMKHIDFFILFFILMLFLTSLILFCMGFSIFFNRAVFAIISLIVIYIISFSLLMVSYFVDKTEINYFPLPLMSKLGICLVPPGALLTMFMIAGFYETSGEGVHWYNLTEYGVSPDLHMLMVMLSVLFSCLLYVIIIWYFDAVWPWQPGVPKPFYFLFTKSYWFSPSSKENDEIELVHNEMSSDFFEEEPRGLSPGVTVSGLSKEFRTGFHKKLVVNNVSLNIYQGQITALLGHNGAGKTTIINILTGLITPSKGSASINGRDILTETVIARRGIGVCPQHNVLFDTLTVEEHLKIYAALKGTKWSSLGKEASKIMEVVKLSDKKNVLARSLSGGMKRKLCLGNALVGDSTVLFLDEPTSGLDVESRRGVWDALLDLRQNRTIILTTHYMEEADILGDRIAIMAEGEIQCYGSPMFLKRKFGNFHKNFTYDSN